MSQDSSLDLPIILDAALQFGTRTARVRLRGATGPLLNHDEIQRRWGPFIRRTPVEGDEDIVLDLISQEGPWPRPDQPPRVSLTASRRGGACLVLRDDIHVTLNRAAAMMEGHIAPRLPAVEECLRMLLWLQLTQDERSPGLMIHSASTVHQDRAVCFPAYGGTGKSTLASLTPGELALSDEISLLTREADGWVVWPCPFWNWPRQSQAPEISPWPLEALAFLEQALTTRYTPLRADEGLTRLMEQAVAFDAFPMASSRTFELAADLVQELRRQRKLGILHLLKGDDPYPAVFT